jgi:hypothetical protein
MSILTSPFNRAVTSILYGRFESIEVVHGLSAVIHGLWLIFPDWTLVYMRVDTVTTTPRAFERGFGFMMALIGLSVLAGVVTKRHRVRKTAGMTIFLMWFFLSMLAMLAGGPTGVVWVGYLTISFVSAVVYLNISTGVHHGTE